MTTYINLSIVRDICDTALEGKVTPLNDVGAHCEAILAASAQEYLTFEYQAHVGWIVRPGARAGELDARFSAELLCPDGDDEDEGEV